MPTTEQIKQAREVSVIFEVDGKVTISGEINACQKIRSALAALEMLTPKPIEDAPDTVEPLLVVDKKRKQPFEAWFGHDLNIRDEQMSWFTGDGDDFSCGYYYTPCEPTHYYFALTDLPKPEGGDDGL